MLLSDKSKRQLIYFADPMCSWCWGFSPVIEQIDGVYGKVLPIRLVMGGLRAGNTVAMSSSMKENIKGHWRHVEEMTGQGFDYSFFDRKDFVYDTAPACRAIVAAREAFPGRDLAFLKHLHAAFYQGGIDLTSGPELLRLAIEFGFDEELFANMFEGKACSRVLADDFNHVLSNGIRAFPALLGGSDQDDYMSITHGWRSFDELTPSLERLLNTPSLPSGLMPGLSSASCSLDDQ